MPPTNFLSTNEEERFQNLLPEEDMNKTEMRERTLLFKKIWDRE